MRCDGLAVTGHRGLLRGSRHVGGAADGLRAGGVPGRADADVAAAAEPDAGTGPGRRADRRQPDDGQAVGPQMADRPTLDRAEGAGAGPCRPLGRLLIAEVQRTAPNDGDDRRPEPVRVPLASRVGWTCRGGQRPEALAAPRAAASYGGMGAARGYYPPNAPRLPPEPPYQHELTAPEVIGSPRKPGAADSALAASRCRAAATPGFHKCRRVRRRTGPGMPRRDRGKGRSPRGSVTPVPSNDTSSHRLRWIRKPKGRRGSVAVSGRVALDAERRQVTWILRPPRLGPGERTGFQGGMRPAASNGPETSTGARFPGHLMCSSASEGLQ